MSCSTTCHVGYSFCSQYSSTTQIKTVRQNTTNTHIEIALLHPNFYPTPIYINIQYLCSNFPIRWAVAGRNRRQRRLQARTLTSLVCVISTALSRLRRLQLRRASPFLDTLHVRRMKSFRISCQTRFVRATRATYGETGKLASWHNYGSTIDNYILFFA